MIIEKAASQNGYHYKKYSRDDGKILGYIDFYRNGQTRYHTHHWWGDMSISKETFFNNLYRAGEITKEELVLEML